MKQIGVILGAVVLAGFIVYAGTHWEGLKNEGENSEKDSQSGIKGEVRLGPTCPGTARSLPGTDECSDKLFQIDLLLMNPDTEVVIKEFSSGKDGKFSIEVEPGEYMIRSLPSDKPYPNCGKSGVIPVPEGRSVKVIVFCDTGIR